MLAEDDRIGVTDRRLQERLSVLGGGRADHFQAGGVGEPRFRVLGVIRAGTDTAPGRQANHHGAWLLPAVEDLGDHIDGLVETAGDEVAELHFYDRPIAHQGSAGGDAEGAAFGDRGIANPIGPTLMHAFGDPERPLKDGDVLAHDEGLVVRFHLTQQGAMDSFHIGTKLTFALFVKGIVQLLICFEIHLPRAPGQGG